MLMRGNVADLLYANMRQGKSSNRRKGCLPCASLCCFLLLRWFCDSATINKICAAGISAASCDAALLEFFCVCSTQHPALLVLQLFDFSDFYYFLFLFLILILPHCVRLPLCLSTFMLIFICCVATNLQIIRCNKSA